MSTTPCGSGPRLGLAGLSPHKWPSINRTLAFYQRALLPLAATMLEVAPSEDLPPGLDLLLNCTGDAGWTLAETARDVPVAFCMHGGCVLSRDFVRSRLPTLWSTDTFIVNCQSDQQLLQAMVAAGKPNIAILPLPVDIENFRPEGRAAARAELSIEQSEFCIGIVARLVPQKNIHGALEVASEVARKLIPRKIRIVIVGNFWSDYPVLRFEGESYSQQLRAKIEQLGLSNHITYLPASLSDLELARVYRTFDVLLHPTHSIDENFGYAPVEAMASGVPVVGCAYGGLKDTVIHGETGMLADTWLSLGGLREDRAALVRSVCQLAEDSDLHHRMADQARHRAEKYFSEAYCCRILQDIILKAIAVWREEPRMRAVLFDEGDQSEYDSYLSPLTDRLSSYSISIQHYVSIDIPKVVPGCILGTYGILRPELEKYRLTNPAWPALYSLSDRQLEIISLLSHPRSLSALIDHYTVEELQALVEMGVLVAVREAEA